MKTQFSTITFFDPYGDGKSTRVEHSRKNYESDLPLGEVAQIISTYNEDKYYDAVKLAASDGRMKRTYFFDNSHYNQFKDQFS